MTKVYEYNGKTYVEHEKTTLEVTVTKQEAETNIQYYIDLIENIRSEL